MTCWKAITPDDGRLPERIRRVHLSEDLAVAGLERVEVADRPDWLEAERAKWEAVGQADPSEAAVRSMQEEATSVLCWLDHARRVRATAIASPHC